jgi:small conductance mechanosensitive channel
MEAITGFFDQLHWQAIAIGAVRILMVLIVVWIVLAVLKSLLRRLGETLVRRSETEGEQDTESIKRVETLIRLVRQAVTIVVWVVALLIVLKEMGVDITPILASAGIVGLAVGFGAQNLVRDVISGFFIILENQVRVGDVAIINGTGGLVEKVNFRTIVLRDLAGVVHVFPNGTINTLSNMTHEWSAYVFDIGVAYKEDTDQVVELMKKVGNELRTDPHFGPLMLDDVEVFGVDKFDDSAVIIKGRLRTQPIKQWDIGREYQRRIKKAFDEAGIEIPFPHRSINFGEASKPFLTQLMNTSQEPIDEKIS